MKTVIKMAQESTLLDSRDDWNSVPNEYREAIERFAELVRADERKANIGCIGRIAAMVVDPIDQARLYEAMDAIRARSNT